MADYELPLRYSFSTLSGLRPLATGSADTRNDDYPTVGHRFIQRPPEPVPTQNLRVTDFRAVAT